MVFFKGKNKSNMLKKKGPFSHYFNKTKSMFWGISQWFFLKEIKYILEKYTYQIYWTLLGKFIGPYQYAKFLLFKSGRLYFT